MGDEIQLYDPVPPDPKRAQIERAQETCPVRVIAVEPGGFPEAMKL
ncbi:hypothetical protein ACLBXO_15495 [Methylobacterium sp. C33D]